MKFLLDENLSPRLINRLDQLFPGLAHVGQFGLKRSGDIVIFEWAKANEFGVITTDADFVALAQRLVRAYERSLQITTQLPRLHQPKLIFQFVDPVFNRLRSLPRRLRLG